VHSSRTNPRTFITQILRPLKRQPDRPPAINASRRPIAHHTNRNLAHNEICRLTPGRLEEAEDWNSIGGHVVFACFCHFEAKRGIPIATMMRGFNRDSSPGGSE
jgi:hypothetical protein